MSTTSVMRVRGGNQFFVRGGIVLASFVFGCLLAEYGGLVLDFFTEAAAPRPSFEWRSGLCVAVILLILGVFFGQDLIPATSRLRRVMYLEAEEAYGKCAVFPTFLGVLYWFGLFRVKFTLLQMYLGVSVPAEWVGFWWTIATILIGVGSYWSAFVWQETKS